MVPSATPVASDISANRKIFIKNSTKKKGIEGIKEITVDDLHNETRTFEGFFFIR